MLPRPRLFVKKRGTRRTGARWAGELAEGLLCVGSMAAGAFGLYWLINHVGSAKGAGWWPWFAMVIPIALFIYGAVDLVALVWQSIASTERRAAAVRKATGWELPGIDSRPNHPALPSVPAIDAVTDSPGIRLAYRLPIDAASGWVSFTMAAVCLAWNTLVAVFVVQVIQMHRAGEPNWLLTWLMVPFVLGGVWTLVELGRQVLLNIAVGTTRVEISQHPFSSGWRLSRIRLANGSAARSLAPGPIRVRRASHPSTGYRHAACDLPRVSCHAVQPTKIRYHTAADVGRDVRYPSARIGNALVRIAAQRGNVGSVSPRPHGAVGRLRTALSNLRVSGRGCENIRFHRTTFRGPKLIPMTPSAIRITFDSPTGHYQPGERLTGRYMVESTQLQRARAVEVSVLWYTSGKGEEDMSVHYFERLVDDPSRPLDLRVPRRFATLMPSSPLSYEGVILKICWCVRVRVFLSQGQETVSEMAFSFGNVPAGEIQQPVAD